MLWMFTSTLLLSQLHFMIFRATLTPLATFCKYKSLRCPPFGKIFTPVKELNTVFYYNFKYIYKFFLSSSVFIFCFIMVFWLLWSSLELRQQMVDSVGKKKKANYWTVKWMYFKQMKNRYLVQIDLIAWLKDCESRNKILRGMLSKSL